MIAVLPEILFADSEQGTQEIEAKPKKQFDANFIKAHFPQFKVKYTDTYYRQAIVLFLTSFAEPIKKITEFILSAKKSEVSPIFIVDDTEDEDEAAKEEEEEEEEESKSNVLDLIGKVKNLGLLKAKLIAILSSVGSVLAWPFKWAAKKFIAFLLRFLGRKTGKIFRKIFHTVVKWLGRVWKKHIRPMWRRLKKRFWRMWGRAKKWIRKILRRGKVVWRNIRRFLLKHSKILLRIIKKLGLKLLRILVKVVINATASALTASGVGTAAGLAIFVALRAWDAYEVYSTVKDVAGAFKPGEGQDEEEDIFEGEEDEKDEADEGAEEEAPRQVAKQQTAPPPPPTQPQQPQGLQLEAPKARKQLTPEQKYEGLNDDITKALEKSPNYSYQIISKLYRTYKITANWLLNMQEFVSNVFDYFANDFNKFATEAQNKVDNANLADWQNSEEYKAKTGKDLKHVKKPPHAGEWKIKQADEEIKKLYNRYKIVENGRNLKPGRFSMERWFIKADWKVKNKYNDEKTGETERKIQIFNIKKHDFETGKAYSMAQRVTTDLNIKVFDFFDELEDSFDYREKKIVLLKRKNKLMYFLYNVIAWWNDMSTSLNTTKTNA